MPRSRALTECEILEISKNELNEIIKAYPRVKEVLNKLFRQRVLDTFFVLSPLFSPLSPKEREEVFKRFRPQKVSAGDLSLSPGRPSDLSLSRQKRRGGDIHSGPSWEKDHLRSLWGAETSSERSAPSSIRPRMAHAKTTQPTELLELTKEDLDFFLHRFPSLRLAF